MTEAAVFARVFNHEPLHLSAVAVDKADGRVFVYYVIPGLRWWELRKRRILKAAFRNIREFNEPNDGVVRVAMYETTRERGWRPCAPL